MTLPINRTSGQTVSAADINAVAAGVNAVTALTPSGDTTGATDASAINGAITALGSTGGRVMLGPGTFIVNTPVVIANFVHLAGRGRDATVLKLAGAANVDVIQTASFTTLTGTGANGTSNSGPYSWSVSNLTVDGNRAAQTTSGYGIRAYGYNFDLTDITIRNAYLDGLWTEWGGLNGAFNVEGPESRLRGVKIHDCGRWGWHNRGPDDSIATDCVIWWNNRSAGTAGGVWLEDDRSGSDRFGAAGTVLSGCHIWGDTQNWGLIVDTAAYAVNCEIEGAKVGQILVRGGLSLHGGKQFQLAAYTFPSIGIQIGDDGATAGVPSSFAYTAAFCDIDTLLQNFWGASRVSAPVNWVAGNHSRVDVTAELASGAVSVAIAAGSVGAAATAATLTVASTTGYPTVGRLTVPTSTGFAVLAYTGITATTFTGITVVSGTGTIAAGNAVMNPAGVWGAVDRDSSTTKFRVAATGASRPQIATWSQESVLGGHTREVGTNSTAFLLQSSYNDLLNLNATGTTTGNQLQHINGLLDRWYSGAYSNPTVEIDGATGHINLPSTLPPTATLTAAAGTGATVTINGNDHRGSIAVTTGTTPAAGTLLNFTFRSTWTITPVMVVAAVDAAGAALRPFGNTYSTTQGLLGVGVAPTASTTYYFNYHILG